MLCSTAGCACAARRHPSRWRSAALIGVLMLTLANGAVVWAQGSIPSSLAALGVATTPLWVTLISGFFEGWPKRAEWLGLAIGFTGVYLLNGDGDLRATPAAAGALLLAQLAWAAGAMVFGSIVAFSAFNFLIRNVTPALANSNAYVNPLVAVLLGIGLGGERLGETTVLAMAVILAGVALVLIAHDRAGAR